MNFAESDFLQIVDAFQHVSVGEMHDLLHAALALYREKVCEAEMQIVRHCALLGVPAGGLMRESLIVEAHERLEGYQRVITALEALAELTMKKFCEDLLAVDIEASKRSCTGD